MPEREHNQRILIVDDDPLVLRVMTEVLAESGFNIQTVTDGQAVIPFLEQHTVDLILLDLVMPELEGLETIKMIREKGFSVPVIAMSGYDNTYLKLALLMGADESLRKPFSVWDLLQAVERAFARHKRF